jgi:glycosyltransferase involved in cell wall biosynthesis
MKSKPERVFLTWLTCSTRSQTLAANFHAEPVFFRYLSGKGNAPKAFLRYLLMIFHTIGFVLRRQPKLVFVMNQPVFLPLVLFCLSRITRVKYVIDSHSGLFIKPQWRWSLPLMKYAYRHSLFSIVTNQKHRELVSSWGARVEVLGALSVDQEPVVPFSRPASPCLAVIGAFAEDEPTEEVVAAARRAPEVRFYVTGALKNAPPDLVQNAPANVIFTDYQPRPNYVGIVQAMDGAMILVKNDNVMQMGAYEAMSWEVPIITSDWPVLRENFYKGALFVNNSPDDIVRAVRELLSNLPYYKGEVAGLRRERRQAWEEQISRINEFIKESVG